MAENIKIVLRGFWRGFVDLGRGFNWTYTPPKESEDVGLGKYFAAIGGYMWRVIDKYGSPEVKEAALAPPPPIVL